ncbi:substrate-binding domain-containing protein [Streptomyces litmocidini]|uniref:Substrate-binding domain-containing protein n=1 Tax=Streptomyces litmocidini TaxID=67318 RepID=A0ABW7U4V1_9ACTN
MVTLVARHPGLSAGTVRRVPGGRRSLSAPTRERVRHGIDALALPRRQGRAVPEDVPVVSLRPDQVAVHASVPFTSVSVPVQERGRAAVERPVARLSGRAPRGRERIAPRPTPRASTDPATAAAS